jgi:hypothetical protein
MTNGNFSFQTEKKDEKENVFLSLSLLFSSSTELYVNFIPMTLHNLIECFLSAKSFSFCVALFFSPVRLENIFFGLTHFEFHLFNHAYHYGGRFVKHL